MRFLVVDDHADDRTLAARALRQAFEGCEVIEAGTEAEFRHQLSDGPFDAAITDYQLRWSDGLRVLAALHGRFPALPVVMFTNTGSEEVCAEGMKRGLADYVIKRHGQYQRLGLAVRGALERRALRGQVEALLAEERQARLEAERANRLKEEFLAVLSHELRTPLHAVLGWTSLLRRGLLKDGEEKRAYEVIERNTRAQATLIEDLLEFSRLQSGSLRLDLDETDLAALVASAIATVQPAAAARQVSIRPSLDPTLGAVSADAARLRQVVLNLLTNAIKFSAQGGEVRVALRREDGHAAIEVADRGAGIDPGFLPHVFEPFRQADGSSTRRAGGLGIGLALVQKLAHAHGGSAHAASDGPGLGSTFVVRLPLREAMRGAREHDRGSGEAAAPSLEGVRILAVDDDADALEYLQKLLTHRSASVAIALGAQEALEALARSRPDVLVCDIGMPEMNGYELLGKLRSASDQGLRTLPAIALTAFARPEDRERALLAGFNAFVAKPVDGAELMRQVAMLAGIDQHGKRPR